MRPTKYRIWDKERKIWKEDYHYHLAPNGQLYYDGMNITEHNEIVFWTGLHDDGESFNAENKEIYRHDILEVEYEGKKVICEVLYEAGGYLLASDHFEDGYIWVHELVECDRHYFWIEGSKVLGNKFEHPHLLKGEGTNE